MPVPNYGVLRGKALDGRLAGGGKKPHYQILIRAGGVEHRIAVNVVSDQYPSELRFFLDADFHHPLLAALPGVAEGFTLIASQAGGLALDFVRERLFEPTAMRTVPHDVPGPDNDLAEIFGVHVRRAIERGADVYAFGSKWGPESNKPDQYFGFSPGNGIHDIHLNQGSPEPHADDNGTWQDGALLIHFGAEERWLGFFLAFQSQAAHTDDRGDPLPGSPRFGEWDPAGPGGVWIVAALVNAPESQQSVTLVNLRPEPVDLRGWSIEGTPLDGPEVGPGDSARIPLSLPAAGGTITLVDAAGLAVHGVSYTAAQAATPGWTIVF